jgi:hypothetical protein
LWLCYRKQWFTSSRYLELTWRGKYVRTAGTGNSKGCVTLVNSDSEISEIKHYGNSFELALNNDETFKICNIYAPNGFDDEKNNFFHTAFQDLDIWDRSVIIAGDFNTTLGPSEMHGGHSS